MTCEITQSLHLCPLHLSDQMSQNASKNAGCCTVFLNISASWVDRTSWEMCTSTCCPGQNSSVLQTAGSHPTALLSSVGKTTERFLPCFPWTHSSDPPVHFHTPAGAAEEISLAGEALVNQRLTFHSGLALSGARQFPQLRAKQLINSTTALLGSSLNPGTFHAAEGKNAQYREG